ncbi:hypothetical protein HK096_006389 [Nowakowskiella sp. JEL0078]|nr:hypothetical protein HK096_006389 [Nowakowskiella sp. JEL0078]
MNSEKGPPSDNEFIPQPIPVEVKDIFISSDHPLQAPTENTKPALFTKTRIFIAVIITVIVIAAIVIAVVVSRSASSSVQQSPTQTIGSSPTPTISYPIRVQRGLLLNPKIIKLDNSTVANWSSRTDANDVYYFNIQGSVDTSSFPKSTNNTCAGVVSQTCQKYIESNGDDYYYPVGDVSNITLSLINPTQPSTGVKLIYGIIIVIYLLNSNETKLVGAIINSVTTLHPCLRSSEVHIQCSTTDVDLKVQSISEPTKCNYLYVINHFSGCEVAKF